VYVSKHLSIVIPHDGKTGGGGEGGKRERGEPKRIRGNSKRYEIRAKSKKVRGQIIIMKNKVHCVEATHVTVN
jgi:hypothetical protein